MKVKGSLTALLVTDRVCLLSLWPGLGSPVPVPGCPGAGVSLPSPERHPGAAAQTPHSQEGGRPAVGGPGGGTGGGAVLGQTLHTHTANIITINHAIESKDSLS